MNMAVKAIIAIGVFVAVLSGTTDSWTISGVSDSWNGSWSGKKVSGNGNVTTKQIKTGDYDQIHIGGEVEVALVKGKEGLIEVVTDENLHDVMIVEVKGGKLTVKNEDNVKTRHGIKVSIPFDDISKIHVAGAAELDAKDLIKADQFTLDVSGAAHAKLEIEATDLDAEVSGASNLYLQGVSESLKASSSGSGDFDLKSFEAEHTDVEVSGASDLNLSGSTSDLTVKVSGSGSFRGGDFTAETTEVSVSGAGNATVVAKQSIKAYASGAGSVVYSGKPEKVIADESGAGSIRAM